jgi:hypothetical protein
MNPNGERKRKRNGKAADVESALLIWFTDVRCRDATVTTAILEEKATQLAAQLNQPDFKATSGWISRWKSRNAISYKKCHGEKNDADTTAAHTWSSTVLPDLLESYEPCDIYNADETGIYYRALPDGTLTFSAQKLSGNKKAKDRITALVATNMDGSDKRPLLIIGKSKQPRCFRGIAHLPLPYTHNKNAWMTSTIFHDWLVALEKDMATQKRNIALVIDNCAAHPKTAADELRHVKLVFLPPNVTSLIQPCDMGIIQNLKIFYRKKMVQRTITEIDSTTSNVSASVLARTTNLLDAMHMLKVAWQDVKQMSITNCFKKAGFYICTVDPPVEPEPLPEGLSEDEFNQFVNVDNTLECHGALTDADILQTVQPMTESDEEADEEIPTPPPSTSDAYIALRTVRSYLEHLGADLSTFYTMEKEVQQETSRNVKQSSITDFFKS